MDGLFLAHVGVADAAQAHVSVLVQLPAVEIQASNYSAPESGRRSIELPPSCACLRPTDMCSATKTGFHNLAMKRSDDQYVGPAQEVVAVDDRRDSHSATERWRQVRSAEY